MSFWTGNSKIHELYTAACGLYVCWLSIRGVTVLLAWMPQGRTVIMHKVQEWTLMVGICEQPLLVANTKTGQQSANGNLAFSVQPLDCLELDLNAMFPW